jgi:hypothetical protein
VWTSSDGKEKYDGEWKEDTRHGKGTLISLNGYSYIGEWKENRVCELFFWKSHYSKSIRSFSFVILLKIES